MTLSRTRPERQLRSDALTADRLSYARCAETRAGRALIRGIENMSGRRRLLRSIHGYQDEIGADRSFWEVFWDRFAFQLEAGGVGLEGVPKTGPLVCVANHPWGIVDGLAFCLILAKTRPDFKILANQWLVEAPEIMDHILPIDREPTREAMRVNIETRRKAIAFLKEGGCVAVFPAGSVSASRKVYRRGAFDSHWKSFTATMIQLSKARVTPIFFEGQNSRLFQIAAHLSETLRLALFVNEFDRMVGETVKATIGAPIEQDALAPFFGKPEEMMTFLRSRTYSLSPDFVNRLTAGKPWG